MLNRNFSQNKIESVAANEVAPMSRSGGTHVGCCNRKHHASRAVAKAVTRKPSNTPVHSNPRQITHAICPKPTTHPAGQSHTKKKNRPRHPSPSYEEAAAKLTRAETDGYGGGDGRGAAPDGGGERGAPARGGGGARGRRRGAAPARLPRPLVRLAPPDGGPGGAGVPRRGARPPRLRRLLRAARRVQLHHVPRRRGPRRPHRRARPAPGPPNQSVQELFESWRQATNSTLIAFP
jgi:hypothetical protein